MSSSCIKALNTKTFMYEDIINTLRKNISVSISNDLRRQNDAFTISYQGEEPQTVMKITQCPGVFLHR